MARFKIIDIFEIKSLKNIIIVGELKEGTVSIGMTIKFKPDCHVKIKAVENINGKYNDNYTSQIALRLSSNETTVAELIEAIGMTIDIKF